MECGPGQVWWCMLVTPATLAAERQEDHRFEASVGDLETLPQNLRKG